MVFGSPTFRRFMGYARRYWPLIVGAIVFGVLKFASALLLPLAMGYVIDHVIMVANELPRDVLVRRLIWVVATLVVVYALRIPVSYYRSYHAQLAGNRTIFDIRTDLYHHLQRLSLDYHTRNRTGRTTSRVVNDVNTAQGILDRGVMSVTIDIFFLIGVVVALFAMDWRLASVSLATLPLYGLVFGILNPKLRTASRAVQRQMAELSGEVNEKVMGQPVVMAFVRERTERNRFFREHREYFNRVMRRVRLQVVMQNLAEFLTNLGPIVVICYGTFLVLRGGMTPGGLIAFNGLVAHLYLPTRRLADASAAVQMHLSGLDRVFEILDEAPDIRDLPDAPGLDVREGAIEMEHVTFGYNADQPILRDLSLTIRPGQAVAIVGRSGAGKSTIAKLVPRFYDVNEGAIRIDGQDIREVTQHSLRENIGMVMQDTILFNGTIRENIHYGRRKATEAEMLEAARMAHVEEFIGEMPEGYDTVIGERGVTLSGGQKQRLSIARAFLRDPRILILDEATSSLDSHAESIIQEALTRLMEGRTTLVIAHRLSTILDCDKVVYLEEGHVVQEGTHAELIAQPGPYRALCEEQFGSVQLDRLAG